MTQPETTAERNATGPLNRFVTFRLSRVQAKLNAQASRILKEASGLSLGQWRIIALLGSFGRSTSSELTRLSAIDKGLFSRKLKGLIEDGLVRAETDKADHRIQHLSLTAKGQEVHDTTLPRMRTRQANLQAGISAQDLATFHAVLDKLEIAAEQSGPAK